MTTHEQPQRSSWVSYEVPVQLRIEVDGSGVRAVAQESPPAPAAPSSRRTSPVRVTVDLPPATHIALKRWAADTAVAIGQPNVTNQAILRALVEQLLVDAELAQTIRQQVTSSSPAEA